MTLTATQSATLTGVIAILWPLIQAALDKPYFTAARRRVITLAAIAVVSVFTWAVGAYPDTVQALVTQVLSVAGIILGAFNILKSVKINGVSVIDWAGLLTPGGVDRDKPAA